MQIKVIFVTISIFANVTETDELDCNRIAQTYVVVRERHLVNIK